MMDDLQPVTPPDLADLVGSRLCHDLVNPLSAIANGLELLALSGAPKTPELDLIGAALSDAMARIRFFRVAFGAARPGDTLSEREVQDILSAVYGSGRLSVDWQVMGDPSRRAAKLGFLLLNCAEMALPLGGTLTITEDGGWCVRGAGRKLSIDAELWQGLTRPSSPPAAARVQFSLLAQEVSRQGLTLSHQIDEGANTLCLRAD